MNSTLVAVLLIVVLLAMIAVLLKSIDRKLGMAKTHEACHQIAVLNNELVKLNERLVELQENPVQVEVCIPVVVDTTEHPMRVYVEKSY